MFSYSHGIAINESVKEICCKQARLLMKINFLRMIYLGNNSHLSLHDIKFKVWLTYFQEIIDGSMVKSSVSGT